ncbi:cell division cycle protein 37, partial [Tremellales sp. Uapishka_1]
MPLNYRKWDNLELSDDSDIEEHPNVDKRSMINWRQRDIHDKREARKVKILKLNAELALNAVLAPRIESVQKGLAEKGISHYRSVQRRLKEAPSDEKPQTGAANQPTYDMMMSQLLSDVFRESAWLVEDPTNVKIQQGAVTRDGKKLDEKAGEPAWTAEREIPEAKQADLTKVLAQRIAWHLDELHRRNDEVKKEIAVEEQEQTRKITSDGIRDGFDTSVVQKPTPSPLEDTPKAKAQAKAKAAPKKVETIEVLNPASTSASAPAKEDSEDDDEEFSALTPAGRAFAAIPLGQFAKSYAFIQKDSSVLTEKTHDSMLAEAFDAERRGDVDLAKRCVHQSLLISYCRKLGRDGVGLFFQKMISNNPKSLQMFLEDFTTTYSRIATRTRELEAEHQSAGVEQIQLVAEDPSMEISFNIPDGPPPTEIKLEGEGTEGMDVEDVRRFLQRKWDIFEGFTEGFRAALKTEQLDEVNKVLGAMKVDEAEAVVELMQEGGMLSFSERGVRDMTK